MPDAVTQYRHNSGPTLYLLAFGVFAFLLALRESEAYGHIYDFLPVLGRTIPFFTLTILLVAVYNLRGGSLKDLGLHWPGNKTIFNALIWIFLWAIAILAMRVLSAVLISPLLELLGPRPDTLSRTAPLVGNLTLLTSLLPVMWLVVIGEEVLFRGLLMNFLAHKLGGKTKSWVIAILISSVIFGLGHFWKGPQGMLSSGMAALVFGVGYYLSGRNLWPVIIAHCVGNTIGFVSIYLSN